MEFDRDSKNMIAILAFVAAMAFGINAVVVADADQSFISWSVGLFVVAVLFWIWIRRDDLAEKREDALRTAEDAAKQAEELAKKTQDKAEATIEAGKEKVEILAEEVHDYTDEMEEALQDAEDATEDVVEDVADTTKEAVTEAIDAATVSDEPDDLTQVEGIGPVYRGILYDAGIMTFADVASKSVEEIEAIIKDAGKRRPASIVTWAEQAALAAKGDWDGLAKLQDKLDGGRR